VSSRVESDVVRHALQDVLAPAPEGAVGEASPQGRKMRQGSRKWDLRSNECPEKEPEWAPLRISIVEQLTPSTLSVDWSDPCLGRYSDQVWRIGLARVSSRCVLTGLPIGRGDLIFRPRLCGESQANKHRMILASAASAYLGGP
jgi:hypothetical protein